jgi:hypothetical protein
LISFYLKVFKCIPEDIVRIYILDFLGVGQGRRSTNPVSYRFSDGEKFGIPSYGRKECIAPSLTRTKSRGRKTPERSDEWELVDLPRLDWLL